MATSDSSSVFSRIDGVWTIYDGGSNSLEMPFVQSDLSWVIEGAPYTEAKVRNRHASGAPVLRKTGDGNVSASATLLVKSFSGTSTATPYEVLTLTLLAAAWATTAIGDKRALRHKVTFTDPSGASQTVTFAYAVAMNIKIDPAGGDGLMSMSFDLTDHESEPTVT